MAITRADETTLRQPLRLWPGVIIVALQWLAAFVVPGLAPEARFYGVIVGIFGGGLAVAVWWVLFSRAPWSERLGAIVVTVVAMAVTPRILHQSVREGNLGLQFFLYAIPVVSLALVVWAAAARNLSGGLRRATLVAALLLACGGWALVRSDGLSGEGAPDFTWRWAATAEERLLAGAENEPTAPPSAEAGALADWPGFRGPGRDGAVSGLRIATDWSLTPPVELWRRPVGPAVSSFAAGGGLLYTQEQRGEDEIVAGYRVADGEPVWLHRDAVRFWDSHVGAGPRGTPALGGGRVFALGATGLVNALDAADGSVVWSRDAAADTGMTPPEFGFTGSPLVVGDLVVVAVGGRLAAYEAATGDLRWLGPEGGNGYSSPQPMTIAGVKQVGLASGAGMTSVAPADGRVLWRHTWPGYSYVQPVLAEGSGLLIGDIEFMPRGMRRLAVDRRGDGWAVEERWSSSGLKPHFSGFVAHEGHAYGFDGSILACLGIADGERKWKGGRFGHGQLLLLRDQGLLLVLSERGEIALVAARPEGFAELARRPAIEGRTWNYPALAGDVLLVRNGQEMAAFRLPAAGP